MVVVLGVEVELPPMGIVLFWETTCWRRRKKKGMGGCGRFQTYQTGLQQKLSHEQTHYKKEKD